VLIGLTRLHFDSKEVVVTSNAIRNSRSEIPNLIRNPQSPIQSAICDSIRNPKFAIRNLQFAIRNPHFAILN
ncbi:MAG TPA: hypothetical protein VIV66_17005, partial [Pyrinomonadaceae bacterium]